MVNGTTMCSRIKRRNLLSFQNERQQLQKTTLERKKYTLSEKKRIQNFKRIILRK